MDIYVTSILVSFVYLILSIIEFKISTNETPPLKELFKNTILTFISVIFSIFVIHQLYDKQTPPTEIFTAKPDF